MLSQNEHTRPKRSAAALRAAMRPQGASSQGIHPIPSSFFANLTPSFERNSKNNSSFMNISQHYKSKTLKRSTYLQNYRHVASLLTIFANFNSSNEPRHVSSCLCFAYAVVRNPNNNSFFQGKFVEIND